MSQPPEHPTRRPIRPQLDSCRAQVRNRLRSAIAAHSRPPPGLVPGTSPRGSIAGPIPALHCGLSAPAMKGSSNGVSPVSEPRTGDCAPPSSVGSLNCCWVREGRLRWERCRNQSMIGSTSSVLTRNAGLEGSWSCHRCSCYPMSGAGMCGRRCYRTTAPDQQPPRRRAGQVRRAGRSRLLLLPGHRPAVLRRPRWIGRAPADRVRRRRCPPENFEVMPNSDGASFFGVKNSTRPGRRPFLTTSSAAPRVAGLSPPRTA